MNLRIIRDLTGEGQSEPSESSHPDDDADADIKQLTETLLQFRRSGWGSWTEFLAQAPAVQRLAATVGEHVTNEEIRALAALTGMACGGKPAMIAETLDDEKAREDVASAEVMRAVLQRQNLSGGY